MKKTLVSLALAAVLLVMTAAAEGAISTSMVMRVSHLTQNPIVDAGEDFSMEVTVNGVTPASYQWFYEGAPIDGADQRVLNIVSAQPSDSGVYRMEAYNEDGAMLAGVESMVRVVDDSVPQSGDDSASPAAVTAILCAAAAVLAVTLMKRRAF